MNKKVCIKISGLHGMEPDENEDKIEVINIGNYYKRNGKHYVKYDDPVDMYDSPGTNILKISDSEIELTAKGHGGTHMVFSIGQKNTTYYETPFGGLNLGLDTYDLSVIEKEDSIVADIRYGLEINLEHVAECQVHIEVESVEG